MFSSEKTINNLSDLFQDVKEYVLLQKEYTTLDLVEKLTKLLSFICLGFVLTCMSLLVLFYLSFTLIYLIAPVVGGLTIAYAIMTVALLLLAILVYLKRRSWIIIPITKQIANVLMSDTDFDLEEETHKDENRTDNE